MPDEKLVIRKENFPTRCEICHQADRFDPETGECRRCTGLSPSLLNDPLASQTVEMAQMPSPVELAEQIGRAIKFVKLSFLVLLLVSGIPLLFLLWLYAFSASPFGVALLVWTGVAAFGALVGLSGLMAVGHRRFVPEIVEEVREALGKKPETND